MSTQGGAAVQPLKMSEFSYDSDLIGGSLQVRESRIVSGLLVNDASADERNQAIRVENRLPKRAPATAKRIAQSIRKRLERMEPEFWRALRDGDDDLATQVAFCAARERKHYRERDERCLLNINRTG